MQHTEKWQEPAYVQAALDAIDIGDTDAEVKPGMPLPTVALGTTGALGVLLVVLGIVLLLWGEQSLIWGMGPLNPTGLVCLVLGILMLTVISAIAVRYALELMDLVH